MNFSRSRANRAKSCQSPSVRLTVAGVQLSFTPMDHRFTDAYFRKLVAKGAKVSVRYAKCRGVNHTYVAGGCFEQAPCAQGIETYLKDVGERLGIDPAKIDTSKAW